MTDLMTGTDTASRLPEQISAVLHLLSDSSADGLTQAECLEVVGLLEATKGAAAALQARASARFVEEHDADAEDEARRGDISRQDVARRRSAARSEVALARRCSPAQADRHVMVAAALTSDLPRTMAALTADEISEWRATIVVRETACLSAEDRAEADRRLAPDLSRLGDRALAAAAHRACIDLDQGAIVRRRQRAAASRCVTTRPAPDGMAYLSVLGPLADVVGAYASLSAAEKARFVATGDPVVDAARADDDRGRGAWMADSALERLSGRSEGQAQPVEVGLVMSESALVPTGRAGEDAPADDHVEVPGWGAMPGDTTRAHLLRLLDEGSRVWLRRLWTSPDGRDLVAMDSRRRLFSGGLRRLIELRDPTCRVPWCDAPTRQVDHVVPFARGGPTSGTNAMGLWWADQRHECHGSLPAAQPRQGGARVDREGGLVRSRPRRGRPRGAHEDPHRR